MKFRYYITDTADGTVVGTNDQEQAVRYAQSEDNFVVDSETGNWIDYDGDSNAVQEAKKLDEDEDEDDDPDFEG